jgi:metal-responsive CopG/Arc/MetJ family transcriptional regulator
MSTISLKLPDHLLRLLEKESRARGATKSEVIRESLEQTLVRKKDKGKEVSCYDLSKHVVGSLKGSPDLGINPKYMEGYGE